MAQAEAKSTSGLSIAGLVLGILAAVTSFLPIINNLSAIFALIGGIFALIGLVGALRGKHGSKGMAIAGVVLAVVSFVVVLATQSAYKAALDSALDEMGSQSEPVSSSKAGDSPNEEAATSSDDNNGAEAEAAEPEPEPEQAEEDYAHLSIGQTVTFGSGLEVTVNSVQQGLRNYDDSPITAVNVTYVNASEKNESFNVFDWKAEDANGAQWSMSYYSDSTDELHSGTLSPGGTVSGNIYFDGDVVRVLFYSNMFNNSASAGWDIA